MIERFYSKRKNVYLHDIYKILSLSHKEKKKIKVNNISDIQSAQVNDISFIHSSKYLSFVKKTKSKIIITDIKIAKKLPNNYIKIIVENVLLSVAKVTNYFYPNSLNEKFIPKLKNNYTKKKNIFFSKNVVIGNNVKIGENTYIGINSIIEDNVIIGKNCIIGSNVIIKKCIIGDNVSILDGAIIGKKGFGFFPSKKKNIRYPHIGLVIIGNNVEIGCNNTIDRGSLSNTVIGDNTFLDNQVHIAHNVKIGKNCIITAQVGFAGSAILGDSVSIGGQAGISGHIKIGNNVKIGGGSGVIKNIPDNSKVMGYPAKDIRVFIKENKKNE